MDVLEGYTRDTRYPWKDEYADSDDCLVTNKEIMVPETQRDVTADNNSQYLPFKLERYYDGVDLTADKTIRMVFQTAGKVIGKLDVINVQYDDSYILFGVLLTNAATSGTGKLAIQLEISGTNEDGDPYLLVSHVNRQLTVLETIDQTGGWDNEEITSAKEQILQNKNDIADLKTKVNTLESRPSGGVSIDDVKTEIDTATISIKEDLSLLKNSDKSTTSGKVWMTTESGAQWADAPQGGGTVDAYTKMESDNKYQTKGDYALSSDIPSDDHISELIDNALGTSVDLTRAILEVL